MKKEVQKPSALMTSSEYGLIQGVQQNRFRPLSEL